MNKEKYYLAIDIGASSGRHILGSIKDGKIETEEVYRFKNGNITKDGELVWDVDGLFAEIKAGMKKCAELGKIPESMGIDTWGVDFVLLDENDKRIGNAVAYRDSRTEGIEPEVYKIISEDNLYARTGIQRQPFNTIYQLMALKVKKPEYLKRAKALLMIPDYFNFLLTGIKAQEYTNATTGQLVSPKTFDWDYELIEMLGYPKEIFQKMQKPGTFLGNLSKEVKEEVGFDVRVVLPATHDTGSAVMAVPTNADNTLYISSGTWSLMGTELKAADCSPASKKQNFTNEGGFDRRFRYLKNIMGLWMIQSVRNELAPDLSFGEICDEASKKTIDSIVDANDSRFLAPASMAEEVKKACRESGQAVPEGIFELARVIYRSLAICYKNTVEELEEISGQKYNVINVVGGGANADYLNRLTALMTGRKVYAGPTEATAIGNLLAQMLEAGEVKNLQDARTLVFDSFEVKEY
ncbi:MAG: rhamnulokinase [Lachnospiraceae bacterium]|nr:rhamnulokinase [Lachnospiraceae bacterium]